MEILLCGPVSLCYTVFMQELRAQPRTELGKKSKILREKGFLPAVLYGEGIPSQPLAVLYKDFEKVYREAGESTLVKLEVADKPYNVLVHDVARDPLRGRVIHADFYAVRMDKVIHAKVPLVLVGEAPAVKNEGGVLVRVMQELEVAALPQDLPHELKADLTSLKAVQSKITVRDIPLPPGVKILAHNEEVVVLVEAPRSEEELATLEQASPEAAPLEVKTEQELKKEAKLETAADEPEQGASNPHGI